MRDEIDYIIRNRVSETLVELRKARDITQADLAEVMSLKPTTVASWEQGKSLPSVQMLYKLSLFYGKDINYMYGEREKWQKQESSPQEPIKQEQLRL